ncbi:MAG: hypothetical protein QM734_03040 [Cyclobacteriaceae bacterium]
MGLYLFLLSTSLSSSLVIFSSHFLEFHRASFQSFVSSTAHEQQKVFKFTIQEFLKINWEEEYIEFEINDEMFDVSKIVKTENGYRIYCVKDSMEECLIAMIHAWKQTSPQGKIKLFQPLFCHKIVVELNSSYFFMDEFLTKENSPFESLSSRIPYPPPEEA